MSTLIVMVLSGIIFAYFATQNTGVAYVNMVGVNYSLPIYVIVLGSLLLGLVISGFISMINSVSSMFEINNRDRKINQTEKTVEQLNRQISDLEMENNRLRTKTDTLATNLSPASKTRLFFKKLRSQIPA